MTFLEFLKKKNEKKKHENFIQLELPKDEPPKINKEEEKEDFRVVIIEL